MTPNSLFRGRKLFVLLGDVVSSRLITNRVAFNEKLKETSQEVNAYRQSLYADFRILKGLDEFGCVLTTITDSYTIITTIFERLYPNFARFALVYDYIDTGLDIRDVSLMDGPAFHKASKMLFTLKKSKLLFDMAVQDDVLDASIAGLINLILLTKKNWTERQLQIAKEYKKKKLQSEIAEALGISQQAVSKTLSRSMWGEIASIEERLGYIFEQYGERLE
jgi:predicted DNA-binding protein YlxM (UPF0122 family)